MSPISSVASYAKNINADHLEEVAEETTTKIFQGFTPPVSNYFRMPNESTNIFAEITNLAELKVVQYVLRHTWGYQEYDGKTKVISTDEFMFGRKRNDNSRIDNGTGLSKQSVIDGLRRAVEHNYLICNINAVDKARIIKSYALNMIVSQLDVKDLDSGVKDLDIPDVKDLDSGVKDLDSDQRKTLIERNYKNTNRKSNEKSLTLFFALIEKYGGIEQIEQLLSQKTAPTQQPTRTTRPDVPEKPQLTPEGLHIVELYEVYKKRKVTRTDTNIKAANGLGQTVANDQDFNDVLHVIFNDHFLNKNTVRIDLDFVYRKYDGFLDTVDKYRSEAQKTKSGKGKLTAATAASQVYVDDIEAAANADLMRMSEDEAMALATTAVADAQAHDYTIQAKAVQKKDGKWIVDVTWLLDEHINVESLEYWEKFFPELHKVEQLNRREALAQEKQRRDAIAEHANQDTLYNMQNFNANPRYNKRKKLQEVNL